MFEAVPDNITKVSPSGSLEPVLEELVLVSGCCGSISMASFLLVGDSVNQPCRDQHHHQ